MEILRYILAPLLLLAVIAWLIGDITSRIVDMLFDPICVFDAEDPEDDFKSNTMDELATFLMHGVLTKRKVAKLANYGTISVSKKRLDALSYVYAVVSYDDQEGVLYDSFWLLQKYYRENKDLKPPVTMVKKIRKEHYHLDPETGIIASGDSFIDVTPPEKSAFLGNLTIVHNYLLDEYAEDLLEELKAEVTNGFYQKHQKMMSGR
ncbi:MAG: hypothetical protein Q4B29_00970 [Candidatus Saccharibacteria bacterium]|nr:hypothetical protein [Candidatus Saccharibacteria bacterium]